MNGLQQLQIKQNCKLALPNGLHELMSDISREVLRAQPNDLCNFIAEYLGALLETRDKLTIAAGICDEICHGSCQPELEGELRDIGLSEEEIKLVGKIVQKYFKEEQAQKAHDTLLYELSKKINADESILEAIVEAVMLSFRRNFVNNAVKYETFEDDKDDRATKAAKNTVKFHENEKVGTRDSDTEGPREYKLDKEENLTNEGPKEERKSVTSASSMTLAGSYVSLSNYVQNAVKNSSHSVFTLEDEMVVEAGNKFDEEEIERSKNQDTTQTQVENKEVVLTKLNEEEEIKTEEKIYEKCHPSTSSVSLAGSFLMLPKQKPYNVADDLYTVDESPEKEQMNLDYTAA